MAKSPRAQQDDVRRRRPDDDEDERPRGRRRPDDVDDDDDEGDGPHRRRGRGEDDERDEPLAPRKKRKSAAGPVKLVFKILLGIVGAVTLILVLYWVYTPMGTDSSLLRYFPKETTRLVGYDAKDIMENPNMSEVHRTMMQHYNRATKGAFRSAKLSDKEVERYLAGEIDGGQATLTVVRFRDSVNQAAFKGDLNAREIDLPSGKRYNQVGADGVSFFFPNDRTLVYATTQQACEAALEKTSSRPALEGDMRELADKVDGSFFQANLGWRDINGFGQTLAFSFAFVDPKARDPQSQGVVGTANWYASDGNDFLFGCGALYSDTTVARDVYRGLKTSYDKIQEEIHASDSGIVTAVDDIFTPKQKDAGESASALSKDIVPALNAFAKTARVYTRGRFVVVEGKIPHGIPDKGVFAKFWKNIAGKFSPGGGALPGGGGGPMMGPPGF